MLYWNALNRISVVMSANSAICRKTMLSFREMIIMKFIR